LSGKSGGSATWQTCLSWPSELPLFYILTVCFICEGNQSTQWKPSTCHNNLTSLYHKVVSSTPRHRQKFKTSQILAMLSNWLHIHVSCRLIEIQLQYDHAHDRVPDFIKKIKNRFVLENILLWVFFMYVICHFEYFRNMSSGVTCRQPLWPISLSPYKMI
jgi:hypothetical protein